MFELYTFLCDKQFTRVLTTLRKALELFLKQFGVINLF